TGETPREILSSRCLLLPFDAMRCKETTFPAKGQECGRRITVSLTPTAVTTGNSALEPLAHLIEEVSILLRVSPRTCEIYLAPASSPDEKSEAGQSLLE